MFALGREARKHVFEEIRACQRVTHISIRRQNANHSDFSARQGETRKNFNPF